MWNQSPRMVSGVHLYFRECRLAQRRYFPAALNKLPVWKGSRPGLRKVQVIAFLLSCPGSLPQRSALRFEFPSSYQKNKRKKGGRGKETVTWALGVWFFFFLSFVFSFTAPDAICFPLFCPHYPVWDLTWGGYVRGRGLQGKLCASVTIW